MSSTGDPATTCLGIAIDHRIRKLFQPVPPLPSSTSHGNHVSVVQANGRMLGRPADEIQVTGDLAGPTTTGGIAIVLQQPRERHPFENGTRAVIEECPTLAALEELFATVSCNTLDLLLDISVIDLLPYTTVDNMKSMDDVSLSDQFHTSIEAFCGKEPDIVLCAGKVRLNEQQKHCKGHAWKLESKGVGETFTTYQVVKIVDRTNKRVQIQRVNGFHPSHAINHHPDQSCLIQLLLLIVSQTCGMLRGDWTEEPWMNNLRSQCSELSLEQDQKYLSDYADDYGTITYEIRETIEKIASSHCEPYKGLLESGLSEQLNDASLVLSEMYWLKSKATTDWAAVKDDNVVKQAATDTISLSEQSWDSQGWFGRSDIRDIILDGIKAIRRSATNRPNPVLHLKLASSAFLETAEALELMLWDQLQLKSGEGCAAVNDKHRTQPEDIADSIGRLSLQPSP